MKRYLVFGGLKSDEHPYNSGASSLRLDYENEDEAIEVVNMSVASDGSNWAHVFDQEQRKIIWEA